MLREIDAHRSQSDITKLAGFGTRHTLSSQTDPNRGIGAARDWIYDQFQSYAAASGGRMTVAKQSFVQPPGPPQSRSGDGHEPRCHAARHPAGVRRPRLRGQRPLRLALHRRPAEKALLLARDRHEDDRGVRTSDIVGSSTSDKGRRDPFTVRLFSEGVPTTETPAQAALRQSIGGENDGPSRQLARYVKEVGENSATGMHVRLIWRRERCRQFGDLPPFVDFAYTARVARVNGAAPANLAWAPRAPKEVRIDTTQLTNDTTVTWKANPEPTSRATRWCGVSRPIRCGRTRSRWATSRATRSRTSPRTTSRSACAPWTAAATAARWRSRCPRHRIAAMLFMVRFDITQPESMSTDRLWEVWNDEAKAAMGAKEAGAVVDLWKVAGERVVFALCDFPDGDALDRALASLPIVNALGAGAKTTSWQVYPYEQFAAFLSETVEGGG